MNRLFSACFLCVAALTSSAHAQRSPYCQADLVFDNTLNFFDVSAFLEAFVQDDLAADFNRSGHLNFFDVSAFLQMFAGGCPDLTDSDGDRLPDFVETNNGIYIDAFATGTDPLNPDTDGDKLDDGDEVLGTIDGLTLPNASPVFKDLYIECDWFAGTFQGREENYRPTLAVAVRLIAAFANATTPNPYGNSDGILIHLDYGQGSGFDGGNQLPGEPVFIVFDSEFNALKAEHFDPRRKGYYHYAIFANRYNNETNSSSGFAEINGDDFMVTLSNFNSTNNMSNTIAHELGHNLGFFHGGHDGTNRKPNYNSVMNYRFQFPGIDINGDAVGDGFLDYSTGTYIDLDESALMELDGVNGSVPIDWNSNSVIEPDAYAANINCNSTTSWRPCGVSIGCSDSICGVLTDSDDWSNINWDRLNANVDRRGETSLIECDNWPGK